MKASSPGCFIALSWSKPAYKICQTLFPVRRKRKVNMTVDNNWKKVPGWLLIAAIEISLTIKYDYSEVKVTDWLLYWTKSEVKLTWKEWNKTETKLIPRCNEKSSIFWIHQTQNLLVNYTCRLHYFKLISEFVTFRRPSSQESGSSIFIPAVFPSNIFIDLYRLLLLQIKGP